MVRKEWQDSFHERFKLTGREVLLEKLFLGFSKSVPFSNGNQRLGLRNRYNLDLPNLDKHDLQPKTDQRKRLGVQDP
jgi:hypothetical protein